MPLLFGGVFLAVLAESYYVLSGVGLLLAAWFVFKGRAIGLWIYGTVFIATLLWAIWEVGFDGWQLLPRLAGPTVLMIVTLLFMPLLFDRAPDRSKP